MPKNYSRVEAKNWHEFFVRLEKHPTEVKSFRKWMRENLSPGEFKADVTFLTTYNIAHCHVKSDDDAMLFKLKWSMQLK